MKIKFPKQFPNSTKEPFLATSLHTSSYNCIAWAYGDDTKWYWPDPTNIYYWPKDIPRIIELDSFILLFKGIGYTVCDNGVYEIGFEKIALFANTDGEPLHASRLLPDGNWTSKLGQHIDVSHSIYSMEGGDYGNATIYMKRVNNVFI